MSSDLAISLKGVSKCYHLYDEPSSRLKQMLYNRLPWAKGRRFYRQHWALRRTDLTIRRGETVGIVGQNGSGKSTLLQLICKTLSPTEGDIDVSGRVAPLLQLGAGFNPEFTGRENVLLNAAILGLSSSEILSRFDAIAAFADIGEMIDRPVKLYSSGMYARLAFAVAIHVSPEILIVDEALAVGDEAFQVKCYAKIRQIRDDGATVLFVSHTRSAIMELCDRAVLIDRGEVLADGPPRRVMNFYQKLMFAPEGEKASIRSMIQAGEMPTTNTSRQEAEAASDDDVSSYDHSLQASSMEEWPQRGARISGASLRTLDGRRVNVLSPGHTYLYEYEVDFSEDAFGVWFGMLAKTITGFEIAGISSHPVGNQIEEVLSGSKYKVQFKFQAALTPGIYTLNAGCFGILDGAEVHMHRLVDAVVFRVVPALDGRRVSGYFDIWSKERPCLVSMISESQL